MLTEENEGVQSLSREWQETGGGEEGQKFGGEEDMKAG